MKAPVQDWIEIRRAGRRADWPEVARRATELGWPIVAHHARRAAHFPRSLVSVIWALRLDQGDDVAVAPSFGRTGDVWARIGRGLRLDPIGATANGGTSTEGR